MCARAIDSIDRSSQCSERNNNVSMQKFRVQKCCIHVSHIVNRGRSSQSIESEKADEPSRPSKQPVGVSSLSKCVTPGVHNPSGVACHSVIHIVVPWFDFPPGYRARAITSAFLTSSCALRFEFARFAGSCILLGARLIVDKPREIIIGASRDET